MLGVTNSLPVLIFAWCSKYGRLRTPSNDIKWWTPWWRPYIPFWCWGSPDNIVDLWITYLLHHIWFYYVYDRKIYWTYNFMLSSCLICFLPARWAAAYWSVGVSENKALWPEFVQMGSLTYSVVVNLCLESRIISCRKFRM